MRPRSCAPGGLLVYATCSLEPEEGERQIAAFLAAQPGFARVPIAAAEIGAEPDWISADGELRTLPFHVPQSPPELSGVDGFYAARLRRLVLNRPQLLIHTSSCLAALPAWLGCGAKLSERHGRLPRGTPIASPPRAADAP